MIYNKDAVFPYPVLSRTSSSFKDNFFDFDVEKIRENDSYYYFTLSYKLSSPFIEKLLKERKAILVLIIQSGDNYFEQLEYGKNEVELKKNRLSLSKRTRLQLHIQTLEDITFGESDDLIEFYKEYRDKIEVKSYSLLGYSDEVVFEGSKSKPLDIFEQSIREDLPIPFKVELKSETIMLVFKDRKHSLESSGVKRASRNMYLYIGLYRALVDFIQEIGEEEEFINLETIPTLEKGLHIKLRDLMLSKNITEIDTDNLDEIIQEISDGIIEKFTDGIREMAGNGS